MLPPPLERLPSASAAIWKSGYAAIPIVPEPTSSSADLLSAMAYHTKYVRSTSDLEKSFSANELGAGPSRPMRPPRHGGWDWAETYELRRNAWKPKSARSKSRRRRPLFTIGLIVGVVITLGLGWIVLNDPGPVVVEVEVIDTTWIPPIPEDSDPWRQAHTFDLPTTARPQLAIPKFIGDADRLRNVLSVQNDLTHVLVPISPLTPPTPLLTPIHRPPHAMMIEYYTKGTVSPSVISHPPPQGPDMVYLYVNGTSPYFQNSRTSKLDEENIRIRGKARHWRDNGELRGAVRSAAKSLGEHLHKIHLVTANYDFDHEEYRHILPYKEQVTPGLEVLEWRMGQIPDWLDWDLVSKAHSKMTLHFHDELFRLPQDDGVLDPRVEQAGIKSEDAWRKQAMPSFNSFEIESRVGWMQGLSDNFVLSNDDMFMLVPLGPSDFHHPLLGTIFRFDPNPRLLVAPVVQPNLKSDGGEWGGLKYASSLLSKRFPTRPRAYMHHLPKSLTKSLMQEASVMFAQELSEAATRSFRESRRGVADVEISWLVSHLGVERWREALLWIWSVVKVGGSSGEWDETARDELRKVLNLTRGEEGGIVNIVKPKRSTLDTIDEISREANWGERKSTSYLFSSMDGHLASGPLKSVATTCSINFEKCFPPEFFSTSTPYPAVDMFRDITFKQPECGDCLIDALVSASGPAGLSAFLPSQDDVYYPPHRAPKMWDREEPMLPLTSTWQEADFSMAENVRAGQDFWDGIGLRPDGGVRLLDWSVKLLSRYAYISGSTPMEFAQVHNARQLVTALKRIDLVKDMALACINDDQPDQANGAVVRTTLEKWMTSRWGGVPVDWEREDGEDEEVEEIEENGEPSSPVAGMKEALAAAAAHADNS